MTTLFEPTFADTNALGLLGSTVHFELQSAPDLELHPKAVDLLDRLIGPWQEPEIESKVAVPASGRARRLLGWIYRSCQQSEWPIFQQGAFEPDGTSDLNGRYTLPTRPAYPSLPYSFFQFLLKHTLVSDVQPSHWVWLEKQMDRFLTPMKKAGLTGVNQRMVLLELCKREHALVEVGQNVFQIGTGRSSQFVRGTFTGGTSHTLHLIQANKISTTEVLRLHDIPTVEHKRVYTEKQALAAAEDIGYPVVLKPFNGTRGFGVICDIKDQTELRWAIKETEADINDCLIEKFYEGDYARVTMVGDRFIEVRHVEMPRVLGDGRSTLRALIDAYLDNPEKTFLDNKPRTEKLKVDFDQAVKDAHLLRVIEGQGLHLDQIPTSGESIRIADRISSRSCGSRIVWHRPDEIAPAYQPLFENIQSVFGHTAIGIDVLCFDPATAEHARINEVNFGPMINWYPQLVSSYVDALLDPSFRNGDERL